MKIDANSIRIGDVLSHQDRLWVVLKTMHTQPGKGGAYMQVEMKDIDGGTKVSVRYRSSENVEKAFLEGADYQFLYWDGDNAVVMDNSTYDQLVVPKRLVGEQAVFLKEGLVLKIQQYNGSPVTVEIPETMELKVIECESVVRGQTASSSYKPAVLENGVRVMVPQFIDVEEMIIVKTANGGEYVSRAKQ